jgi:hypothetical protein
MNGPNEFRADLGKLGALIQTRTRQLVQGTARSLATEMMTGGNHSPGTPIDTGFHRSHWDAEIGALPDGGPIGTKEAPDAEAAALRVFGVIEQLEPGDELYLTNNGPGIWPLEFKGHSPQAPSGFVRPAAEAIQLIVDEVAAHVVQVAA